MDNIANSLDSENGTTSTNGTPEKKPDILDFDGGNFMDSPQSKEEENEPLEECSVCRNEMIDTTTLSGCVHEFCYDCIVGWLTKGSGQFCPMCKTPVNFIKRKGTDEEITLEQIKSKIEPEATASEDLVTEKRIVSRKIRSCRRLMNKIDEIIGTKSRSDYNKRPARLEELNRMKQLCVSQLNSLQMLRDDIDHGAAKALIVSKAEFRRLIYERPVISEGLPQENNPLSKSEFLTNLEHYRSVLHSFLSVELKSLPAKIQPRVDNNDSWCFYTLHDVAEGQDEEIINRIFNLITERGTRDLNTRELDAAFNGRVSCRTLIAFLAELRSLINSKKSFLEWCGAVTYRIRTDRGGESVGNEIVTVDDTIEVEPTQSRMDTLRPRQGPVYTPFDRIFGAPSSANRGFTDQRRASSSDTDQDEDIYFQAPLRLGPTAHNPFRPTPRQAFPPIPPAGISWSDLTSTSNKAAPVSVSNPCSSSLSVVNLDDDDENTYRSENYMESDDNTDEEIQVVEQDGTIVLDDSVASQSSPQKNSESSMRKRKSEYSFEDHWKKPKTEILPDGLVDDVHNLITKYNMPMTQAMNMMVSAAQEAIIRSSTPKPNYSTETSSSSRAMSTSSNIQPPDFLPLAGYLSRNGVGLWSKNAPTKPTNGND